MPSYLSRQRAAAVSSHTVPPLPVPTSADLDAQIYAQTWHHALAADAWLRVDILALDEDHAHAVGCLRLEAMGHDAREWTCTENRLRGGAPVERIAAVMGIEGPEEHAQRQIEWACREAISGTTVSAQGDGDHGQDDEDAQDVGDPPLWPTDVDRWAK